MNRLYSIGLLLFTISIAVATADEPNSNVPAGNTRERTAQHDIQGFWKKLDDVERSGGSLPKFFASVSPDVLSEWESLAGSGDDQAQYLLATYLRENAKSIQSRSERQHLAFQLFKSSASQGNGKAYAELGRHYEFGWGTDKKPKLAFDCFQKSANQGCWLGQFRLANAYCDGVSVEKNPTKTAELYLLAADQGHSASQAYLGEIYYQERKYEAAIRWLKIAAEADNQRAQFYLGVCYDDGNGVSKDLKKSLDWFRRAAEQGERTSQFNLGIAYLNGEGVQKSIQTAESWFRKAAVQEHPGAMYQLGHMYYAGNLVLERDAESAVMWWQKASDEGYSKAMNNLGFCFQNGIGVGRDHVKAAELYAKAAQLGVLVAKTNLDNMSRSSGRPNELPEVYFIDLDGRSKPHSYDNNFPFRP